MAAPPAGVPAPKDPTTEPPPVEPAPPGPPEEPTAGSPVAQEPAGSSPDPAPEPEPAATEPAAADDPAAREPAAAEEPAAADPAAEEPAAADPAAGEPGRAWRERVAAVGAAVGAVAGVARVAGVRWGRRAGPALVRAHRSRLDGLTRLPAREVLVAVAVLFAVSVALVDTHVRAYRTLSPVDEIMHLDSVFKAPRTVSAGELLGEEARRAASCRRIQSPFQPPPCDSGLQFQGYPARGQNTAYIHPPTYYQVTHWLADVNANWWGTDDVDSARLGGAVFLGVGLLLLYLLSRRLGASPAAAGGVTLLMAAFAPVWYGSAVVTPDATSLPVGAGVLYATLTWARSPAAVVVLPLAGWAAVTFKLTNILVVGVACGALLLYAGLGGGRWRQRGRRLAVAAGVCLLLAVPALLTAAAVSSATEARAIVPVEELSNRYYVDQLQVGQVLSQWSRLIPPTAIAHIAPFLVDTLEQAGMWARFTALTGALLIFGVLAAVARGPRSRLLFALAVSLTVLTLAGGPLYTLANYSVTHGYFGVSVRYGYVLLPCAAAVLAAGLRDRRLAAGLLLLGGVVVIYGIWLAAAWSAVG